MSGLGKGRQENILLTHTIIKIGGEMSVCTILVQVLCNIYQNPLEAVVSCTPQVWHKYHFVMVDKVNVTHHIFPIVPVWTVTIPPEQLEQA